MKALINRFLRPFNAEVHGRGYLQAISKSDFSRNAFQVQKELLEKYEIKTIFDIGANRGDTVATYLDFFPCATIHAFEPFPGSFNNLKSRFVGNDRVLLNEFAISEQSKSSQMFVNSNVDTNSLLKPIKTGLSSDKSATNIGMIEIKNTSIDEYCFINSIESIDILKMDIQGGELSALQEATTLLI